MIPAVSYHSADAEGLLTQVKGGEIPADQRSRTFFLDGNQGGA